MSSTNLMTDADMQNLKATLGSFGTGTKPDHACRCRTTRLCFAIQRAPRALVASGPRRLRAPSPQGIVAQGHRRPWDNAGLVGSLFR